MSELKFHGDLQHISERQLHFISSVLEERGFKDAKVSIESVGKAGDNYSSNIKRIVAEKNGEEFRMIAKIAHNVEQIRQAVNMNEIFRNEDTIYTKVLPLFTEIEKEASVPDSEKLRYAKCYGTLMEVPNEVILLEDLKVSGYAILDRFKSLTDHDIKLVLKDFAKLHSLSFVLKHKQPETYSDVTQRLANLWEIYAKQEMIMFFAHIEKGVMDLLDKEEHKNALNGLVVQAPDILKKLAEIDHASRFCIIQHGDSWTNNIMFKLENDKSAACCLIDYQQARTNSPVGDLMYMLFNCTDYDTRKQHFYEWIDFYHTQLDKCLSEHGLKINFVYPRDQLVADLKRHGRASMSLSALLAAVLIRDSGDAEKMKDLMEQNMSLDKMMEAMGPKSMDLSSIARYKTRLEGLINSHLELGFI